MKPESTNAVSAAGVQKRKFISPWREARNGFPDGNIRHICFNIGKLSKKILQQGSDSVLYRITSIPFKIPSNYEK